MSDLRADIADPNAQRRQAPLSIDDFDRYLIKPVRLVRLERLKYLSYPHILRHYAICIDQERLKGRLIQLSNIAQADKQQRRDNPPKQTSLKIYQKTLIVLCMLMNRNNWEMISVQQLSSTICQFLVRKRHQIKKFIRKFQMWFEPLQYFIDIEARGKGRAATITQEHLMMMARRQQQLQKQMSLVTEQVDYLERKNRRLKKKYRSAKQKLQLREQQLKKMKDGKEQAIMRQNVDPLQMDEQSQRQFMAELQAEVGGNGYLMEILEEDLRKSKQQRLKKQNQQKPKSFDQQSKITENPRFIMPYQQPTPKIFKTIIKQAKDKELRKILNSQSSSASTPKFGLRKTQLKEETVSVANNKKCSIWIQQKEGRARDQDFRNFDKVKKNQRQPNEVALDEKPRPPIHFYFRLRTKRLAELKDEQNAKEIFREEWKKLSQETKDEEYRKTKIAIEEYKKQLELWNQRNPHQASVASHSSASLPQFSGILLNRRV